VPPGWFFHKFNFTAITTMAPKIPLAAIGTLLQMCAQQRGLVQFRIAAHHQHPALTCQNSFQKPDEHVTFAMLASGSSQVSGHSAISASTSSCVLGQVLACREPGTVQAHSK
jgi:hypothetical protein